MRGLTRFHDMAFVLGLEGAADLADKEVSGHAQR
jgi:hypothetical protein